MIGIFCGPVKDDWEFLDDFIFYHSRIVGTKNIHIIDNESSDPRVLAVYEKYKPKGLNVHVEIGPKRHAEYVNKYIHMYKHLYEYIVPLDSDEFLYSTIAREHGGDFTSIHLILGTFQNLPRHVSVFHVPEALTTMTAPPSVVYPAREINKFQLSSIHDKDIFMPKKIYRSEPFQFITEGNHDGRASHGDHGIIPIGHVHYHHTGNLQKFQRDAKCMKGREYCDIDAPPSVQYDTLYATPDKEHVCDCHRVITYSKKLVEIELLDIFLKYKKKIPTKDELMDVVERIHWTGVWADIFKEFTETVEDGDIPVVNKDAILFAEYTKNVHRYDENYDVIATYISDILRSTR